MHDASLLGVNIQDYIIVRQLAEGGMGVVYEAQHVRLKKRRVVKVLRANCASQYSLHDRFLREAQITAELDHQNIVKVEGMGQLENGQLWIMYEFLDGETLEQRLACGPLHEQVALVVLLQLCDALHYAHSRNVIHRDIKPENIFLCDRSLVKIIDFGIAKGWFEDGIQTQVGLVFGTPAYMPPEQKHDTAAVDQRADVFALAGTVIRMLTGHLPSDWAVSLLPAAWSAPIREAWEVDAARRTPTVRELAMQIALNVPEGSGFVRRWAPGLLRDSGSGRFAFEQETLMPELPGATVPAPPPGPPSATTMRLATGVLMPPLPTTTKSWWRAATIAAIVSTLTVATMGGVRFSMRSEVAPASATPPIAAPPAPPPQLLPADAGIDAPRPDATPELLPDAAAPRLVPRPTRRVRPRATAPAASPATDEDFNPDSPTGTDK